MGWSLILYIEFRVGKMYRLHTQWFSLSCALLRSIWFNRSIVEFINHKGFPFSTYKVIWISDQFSRIYSERMWNEMWRQMFCLWRYLIVKLAANKMLLSIHVLFNYYYYYIYFVLAIFVLCAVHLIHLKSRKMVDLWTLSMVGSVLFFPSFYIRYADLFSCSYSLLLVHSLIHVNSCDYNSILFQSFFFVTFPALFSSKWLSTKCTHKKVILIYSESITFQWKTWLALGTRVRPKNSVKRLSWLFCCLNHLNARTFEGGNDRMIVSNIHAKIHFDVGQINRIPFDQIYI